MLFPRKVFLIISKRQFFFIILNPLSANPTKWSNTLKHFVGNFSTNCLSVFDHFVKLALKGLTHLSPTTSQFSAFIYFAILNTSFLLSFQLMMLLSISFPAIFFAA